MMLPLLLMRCYLACAKGETVTPHIPQCNVYRLFFCGVNAETWDADIDVISSPLRSSSKCRYFDTYRIQVWLWYDICQQNKTCSEVNLNNIILKFFPASVVYSKKKEKNWRACPLCDFKDNMLYKFFLVDRFRRAFLLIFLT